MNLLQIAEVFADKQPHAIRVLRRLWRKSREIELNMQQVLHSVLVPLSKLCRNLCLEKCLQEPDVELEKQGGFC